MQRVMCWTTQVRTTQNCVCCDAHHSKDDAAGHVFRTSMLLCCAVLCCAVRVLCVCWQNTTELISICDKPTFPVPSAMTPPCTQMHMHLKRWLSWLCPVCCVCMYMRACVVVGCRPARDHCALGVAVHGAAISQHHLPARVYSVSRPAPLLEGQTWLVGECVFRACCCRFTNHGGCGCGGQGEGHGGGHGG